MKIIMNFEISKGYQTWKEAFLKNEAMRQGIMLRFWHMVMKRVMKIMFIQ